MRCGGNNVSPEPTHRRRYMGEEGELPHQGVPEAILRRGGVDGEELGTDCGEEPVPVGHCEYELEELDGEGMNGGIFMF